MTVWSSRGIVAPFAVVLTAIGCCCFQSFSEPVVDPKLPPALLNTLAIPPLCSETLRERAYPAAACVMSNSTLPPVIVNATEPDGRRQRNWPGC